MKNPSPLQVREQKLIELYSHCQLTMTPRQFYAKWDVSQEEIAQICSRSLSAVQHWFAKGRSYRRPMPSDLRHLALMDFILEHFEEIPEEISQKLCLTKNKQERSKISMSE